jgi:GTP cyclohydrolase IB
MTARLPALVDVQSTADTRHMAIDKVGVKDIRHPVRVVQRDGGQQHTVASLSMYVNLPHNFKGTHMSRFLEVLNASKHELDFHSFRAMLPAMCERLDAESGYIDMSFPYFIEKAAPVSGVQSLLDYQISFVGSHTGDRTTISVRITVPVTSLCPCSKEISRYGAHNQRSHVTVTAGIRSFLWLEELIELVEREASCELYGLLKRPDEKFVTERAYENPKFVEDLVRGIAMHLEADERIDGFTVEAENFESIHNHSAYALIDRPVMQDLR